MIMQDSSLTFNFGLSGTLTVTSSAYLTLSYGSFSNTYLLTSGVSILSVQLPLDAITYHSISQPIQGKYSETLSASVSNGGNPGSNTADFSDTVQLTSIDATDPNGNPLAGIFTDGDLISLEANTELTSEPNTRALLVPSILLLEVFGNEALPEGVRFIFPLCHGVTFTADYLLAASCALRAPGQRTLA